MKRIAWSSWLFIFIWKNVLSRSALSDSIFGAEAGHDGACAVIEHRRRACGSAGVHLEECLAENCCWEPCSDCDHFVPWCFQPAFVVRATEPPRPPPPMLRVGGIGGGRFGSGRREQDSRGGIREQNSGSGRREQDSGGGRREQDVGGGRREQNAGGGRREQGSGGRRREQHVGPKVRLVDGDEPSEGRVEVYQRGEWGTVCDDGWTDRDARVVCRQLGFMGGAAMGNALFGEGSGPVHLDEVDCRGAEDDLLDCDAIEWWLADCQHAEDAGVICQPNVTHVPDFTARLVGGSNDREGRVEIMFNKEWGTVCDDYWSEEDAKVVCRELGLSGGRALEKAYFGRGKGPIHLDNVNCDGSEHGLEECPASWDDHDCSHYEDAGVQCDEPKSANKILEEPDAILQAPKAVTPNGKPKGKQKGKQKGKSKGRQKGNKKTKQKGKQKGKQKAKQKVKQRVTRSTATITGLLRNNSLSETRNGMTDSNAVVRLVGGSSQTKGRVEVNHEGVWGTVCDDYWDDLDAMVVCRQLGYGMGEARSEAFFGAGKGPIHVDTIRCTGNETQLGECWHDPWGQHDCTHNEDASAICYTTSSGNTEIHYWNPVRLADGDHQSGRVEVYMNDAWGTVCDDGWEDVDATVTCRQLGFSTGVAIHAAAFGPGTGPIVMDFVQCDGHEAELTWCRFSGVGDYYCSHNEDAGVHCS